MKNAGNVNPAYGHCCKVQISRRAIAANETEPIQLSTSRQVNSKTLSSDCFREHCVSITLYLQRRKFARQTPQKITSRIAVKSSREEDLAPFRWPCRHSSSRQLQNSLMPITATELKPTPTTSSKQNKTPGRRIWQLQKPSFKGGVLTKD